MSACDDNVFPETAPLVYRARSLAERPLEERLVPTRNLGALLAGWAAQMPAREYLIAPDEEGGVRRFTYADAFDRARGLAGALVGPLGLAAGDRIATFTGNTPETALLYLAAWLAGITVVPINTGEDDERIRFVLDNAQVKIAFVPEAQRERTRGTGCRTLRPDEIPGSPPLAPLPDLPPDTEALIVYTSGTTGPPKGVVLEHYNLLVDALGIADWHRLGPDDRALCVLPIHHVNGTEVTLVTPLFTGGSVVLPRRFSASAFWRTLAAFGCTWTSVVPTVLAFLCERGASDLSGLDLSRFRHFICGAGPLTTDLAARFETVFGKRIVHGYGLSETTCYSCFCPIDLPEAQHRRWLFESGFPSIGVPIPVNEMAIHDERGNPLGPEARGEIVLRGHNVMRAYYRRPDANASAFAHGWFRSGDEGFFRVAEDGRRYFFITGRLKELIIRGGVNYSPLEIDEVLAAIPGVQAAMAVGFENDFYGEEIGAYIQPMPGARLTAEEVLAYCAARLPFAKRPKVAVFGDDFPVTSTGKYQRSRLRERFAPWKAAEFRP